MVGWNFGLGKSKTGISIGMVDIPFTRRIRDQLIGEGQTDYHHLLRDSGWTTTFVRDENDVQRAIWLYKVSYIQKGLRRQQGQATDLSPALREIIAPPKKQP